MKKYFIYRRSVKSCKNQYRYNFRLWRIAKSFEQAHKIIDKYVFKKRYSYRIFEGNIIEIIDL